LTEEDRLGTSLQRKTRERKKRLLQNEGEEVEEDATTQYQTGGYGVVSEH
jgi:hypothetical protein